MKILNLASFQGNMGDLVNHQGTRKELAKTFDFHYFPLEIREFYWGNLQWDMLPTLTKGYDLLMVGPGNFLELHHETRSGTSLDLPLELWERIEIPVLFYGIGIDAARGITDYSKAKAFFKYVTETPNRLLVPRNDGSLRTLREFFNLDAMEVSDGGFFYNSNKAAYTHWAVQVAGDMANVRYQGSTDFLGDFAAVLAEEMREDPSINLVFMPHVPADYWVIDKCLRWLPDELVRTRVQVAPYNVGNLFGMYNCRLSLSMRFHANVCSLAQGTKTIGINTYPQIQYLYEGLGLQDWLATTPEQIKELIHKKGHQKYTLPNIREVHGKIREWLKSCT